MEPHYTEGQRVFCFEPNLKKARILYEAKIDASIKKRIGPSCYRVTLFDWNQLYKDRPKKYSYEHEIPEDFILKSNQRHKRVANRLIRFTVKLESDADIKKVVYDILNGAVETQQLKKFPPHVEVTPEEDQEPERGEREETESDEDYIISFDIPEELKSILESDCDDVLLHKKISLAEPGGTIIEIFESFIRSYAQSLFYDKPKHRDPYKPETRLSLTKEVLEGLRCLFDVTVDMILLYKHEKRVHNKVLTGEILPTPGSPVSGGRPRRMTRSSVTAELPEPGSPLSQQADMSAAAHKLLAGIGEASGMAPAKKARFSSHLQGTASDRSTPVPNSTAVAEQIIRELSEWRLISDDRKNSDFRFIALPSMKYGFVHLCRLYVKMPDILTRMRIPRERRLFVDSVLQALLCYLNEERYVYTSTKFTKKLNIPANN